MSPPSTWRRSPPAAPPSSLFKSLQSSSPAPSPPTEVVGGAGSNPLIMVFGDHPHPEATQGPTLSHLISINPGVMEGFLL